MWLHYSGADATAVGRLALRATSITMPMYSQCIPMLSRVHVTEIIGQMLNVPVDDRRLVIALTPEEDARARSILAPYRNPVIIHITSKCSANQNWPMWRWEAFVKENAGYTFVQVGLADEQAVPGAIDLRGNTTLRESVALLKHAKSFVGVVSFLSHATSATGTRGVVLFGPSAPEVWGHSNNRNLTRHLRCAPCVDTLKGAPCPYGAPCLSDITVEEVSEALRQQAGDAAAPTVAPDVEHAASF
jgi:ADP-heptose:LPS heptosyltransferase